MFYTNRDLRVLYTFTLHRKSGVAVVIASTILLFVMLLTISLSILVSLESRVSGIHSAKEKTEQKAPFSLQLAIAQLQIHAGPYQRTIRHANIADVSISGGAIGLMIAFDGTRHRTSFWVNANELYESYSVESSGHFFDPPDSADIPHHPGELTGNVINANAPGADLGFGTGVKEELMVELATGERFEFKVDKRDEEWELLQNNAFVMSLNKTRTVFLTNSEASFVTIGYLSGIINSSDVKLLSVEDEA